MPIATATLTGGIGDLRHVVARRRGIREIRETTRLETWTLAELGEIPETGHCQQAPLTQTLRLLVHSPTVEGLEGAGDDPTGIFADVAEVTTTTSAISGSFLGHGVGRGDHRREETRLERNAKSTVEMIEDLSAARMSEGSTTVIKARHGL